MWDVAIVDNSGAVIEVLFQGERELRGAVAFAAGYGQTTVGAVVVMPSAPVDSDSVGVALPITTGGKFSVFIEADGSESQLNTEPYDAEQVAYLIDSVGYQHFRIVRATENELEQHAVALRRPALRVDNHSGARGVYFSGGKWRAEIRFDGRKRCLGTFATKEAAITARKQAEDRLG